VAAADNENLAPFSAVPVEGLFRLLLPHRFTAFLNNGLVCLASRWIALFKVHAIIAHVIHLVVFAGETCLGFWRVGTARLLQNATTGWGSRATNGIYSK
jgi:hypothetical protein